MLCVCVYWQRIMQQYTSKTTPFFYGEQSATKLQFLWVNRAHKSPSLAVFLQLLIIFKCMSWSFRGLQPPEMIHQKLWSKKRLIKKTFLHSRRGKVSGGWYSILTRNRYIYTLKSQRVLVVVRESCAWKDHVVGTKPHRWYSLHVQYTHVVWTEHSRHTSSQRLRKPNIFDIY